MPLQVLFILDKQNVQTPKKGDQGPGIKKIQTLLMDEGFLTNEEVLTEIVIEPRSEKC